MDIHCLSTACVCARVCAWWPLPSLQTRLSLTQPTLRLLCSGPWNSWDRVPYITTLRNGSASIVPADRRIHHNLIIANYNSEGAIDTDDGSAYYSVYDNFFAMGANDTLHSYPLKTI